MKLRKECPRHETEGLVRSLETITSQLTSYIFGECENSRGGRGIAMEIEHVKDTNTGDPTEEVIHEEEE